MSQATQRRIVKVVVGTKSNFEVVMSVMVMIKQRSYVVWYPV